MAKKYFFQFPGTEEDFLRSLSKYPNNHHNSYYIDDYIVRIENGEYKFGVARGGHSGGYSLLCSSKSRKERQKKSLRKTNYLT